MRRLDLTWKRFWKLFVIWFGCVIKKHSYRNCICDCWTEKIIKWCNLTIWCSKSCWCLVVTRMTKEKTTHWMSWTRFYRSWFSAKQRCINKNNSDYKDYWLRCIKCERELFEEFRDDMYESYLKHVEEYWWKQTTIDRIDVNWNYCKENCRRSTQKEQSNNRRNNHVICMLWESKTISQWAQIYNIKPKTIYSRIKTYWWNVIDAITTPIYIYPNK